MKPSQHFAAFTLLLIMLSLATATVCAETQVFTHDNGDTAHVAANGRAVFAVGATMSIETEQGGGWLPNKTYHVNWTLRLDSVTPQFLNGTNFYIFFSWPPLETVIPTIPAETLVNQVKLSLEHREGTLSAAFTPTEDSDGFFMNPEFPFAVYVDGEALTEEWASGVWRGGAATSTNVIDPYATPTVTTWPPTANPEFPTLTITATVADV